MFSRRPTPLRRVQRELACGGYSLTAVPLWTACTADAFVAKLSFRGSDDTSCLLKTPRYIHPRWSRKINIATLYCCGCWFGLKAVAVPASDRRVAVADVWLSSPCPASLRHCSRQVFSLYKYYIILYYYILSCIATHTVGLFIIINSLNLLRAPAFGNTIIICINIYIYYSVLF